MRVGAVCPSPKRAAMASLLGQAIPPARDAIIACEQSQLPGRRYPDNAHGFTSSDSFAAIRNEVNLLPFPGPRRPDRRSHPPPRS